MEANPFEVLGISKQSLEKLSTSDAMSRVRAIYRALMVEVHPDRGGDPVQADRVIRAFKTLTESSEEFQRQKVEYTRAIPVEAEIRQLQQELRSTRLKTAKIFDSLEFYVRAAGRQERGLTVFNCAPCTIVLEDEYKRKVEETRLVDDHSVIAQKMSDERLLRFEQSLRRTITLGSNDSMTIRQAGKREMYRAERALVGTLKGLSIEDVLKRLSAQRDDRIGIAGGSKGATNEVSSIAIPAAMFARQFIPFLRPELQKNRLLVSCRRGEEGVLYLIEGRIEAVETI